MEAGWVFGAFSSSASAAGHLVTLDFAAELVWLDAQTVTFPL